MGNAMKPLTTGTPKANTNIPSNAIPDRIDEDPGPTFLRHEVGAECDDMPGKVPYKSRRTSHSPWLVPASSLPFHYIVPLRAFALYGPPSVNQDQTIAP